MTYLEALILGVVQGLTEFLPVSSSGHLELGKALFGDTLMPEDSLLFTVVVHFATALATLVVFRRQIAELLVGLARLTRNDEAEFALKIVLSMVPAVAVGIGFAAQIERLFDHQVLLVGAMLLVTAALLFAADRVRDTSRGVGYGDAFLIGIAQAVAILPGISRSGATISVSVLLGIDRTKAASFSFLMVVPLIIGRIIVDLGRGGFEPNGQQAGVMAVGFVAAFVTGVVACRWMVRLVERSQLRYFSLYCIAVGLTAIAVETL